MVEPSLSNFCEITANFSGVRILTVGLRAISSSNPCLFLWPQYIPKQKITWLGDLRKNGKGTGPSEDEGQSSSAKSERLSRKPPPWSITPSDRNLHSHHWSYRDDHLKQTEINLLYNRHSNALAKSYYMPSTRITPIICDSIFPVLLS